MIDVVYLSRVFFFFNDTATTEIYTLSLHDALPIYYGVVLDAAEACLFALANPPEFLIGPIRAAEAARDPGPALLNLLAKLWGRSEEHTSELQSRQYLVCRLLLEKKKHITQRQSFLI